MHMAVGPLDGAMPASQASRNRLFIVVGGIFLLIMIMFSYRGDRLGKLELYDLSPQGQVDTMDYKLYFHRKDTTTQMSPWHDISLWPTQSIREKLVDDTNVFMFVLEIPRGSKAKMEINKETPYNPIIQDTKKGKLRYYPWDSLVNYGAFPQTWEDPKAADTIIPQYKGDNDPCDVIDLSPTETTTGDVYPVKVVGALGMIDDGELDWKIAVIDARDPLAQEVDDLATLPKSHPLHERLDKIRVWFRDYKTPDGKPENEFAEGGRWFGATQAVEVVRHQHALWKAMVKSQRGEGEELWWVPQPNAA